MSKKIMIIAAAIALLFPGRSMPEAMRGVKVAVVPFEVYSMENKQAMGCKNLDEIMDTLTWLLRRAGAYLQTRGEPKSARPLYERAYVLNRDRLRPDDPDMLDLAHDLARNLREYGRPAPTRRSAIGCRGHHRRVSGRVREASGATEREARSRLEGLQTTTGFG